MRNVFPSSETVLKIDTGEYAGMYVFPKYSAEGQIYQSAEATVVGAIKGNGNPLLGVRAGNSRNEELKIANINRVLGYTFEELDVPAEVSSKVDEYNELSRKTSELEAEDKEVPEEDKEALIKLHQDLTDYFSQ